MKLTTKTTTSVTGLILELDSVDVANLLHVLVKVSDLRRGAFKHSIDPSAHTWPWLDQFIHDLRKVKMGEQQ